MSIWMEVEETEILIQVHLLSKPELSLGTPDKSLKELMMNIT